MTAEDLVAVMERTLITALQLGGPVVMASLVVGLVVSIIQAATQINEATLTFVPKLIVIAGLMVALGPWMLQSLTDLTRFVLEVAANSAPVNHG